MEVPVSWISYCADNPARGRWDQAELARILAGEQWRVPGGFTFVDTPWTPEDGKGRVIIFPCGHYAEHGDHVTWKLQTQLAMLKWSVLIATSDEGSSFEWDKITLPSTCKLWVMTPRPENEYPEGTRFIGEGCPLSPAEVAAVAWPGFFKGTDIFFAGQINHERRESMMEALDELADADELKVVTLGTGGFAQGLSRDDYLTNLTRAKIAPCPAGALTQDSFRFFEALEAQCVPVVDALRSDGGGLGYWEMLFGYPGPRQALGWEGFHPVMDRYSEAQAEVSAWWQGYKRDLVWQLHRDAQHVMFNGWLDDFPTFHSQANDDVTVIIPTSPTPSNPDISMIQNTVASVRRYLPTAEIIITIDGVRPEQKDRSDDYWEYARRLCAWTNTQPNVVPIVHTEHMHQSGMMRDALTRVRTALVLYVEHDTPLVGEIDFDEVIEMMMENELAMLRFSHEAFILEEHDHLFLERAPGGAPFVRTIQWSQRPHLAGADWYRDLIATYFGRDSRTMIEDVMHGVVQHEVFTDRKRLEEAWAKWRLAVYAPPGDIKRSEHSDGRAGDPKYTMFVSYDTEEVPPGAPQPGWM